MAARRLLLALALVTGLAAAPGCGGKAGVGGVAGDPVGGTGTGAGPGLPGPTAVAPSTSAPATTPATPTTGGPGPTAPATSTAVRPLRLGGDDLGVTKVGAPFRDAVAAVSAVLGRPSRDPAPDTACIGAEEETSWGTFRLAASGGILSGWASTSTLATPAGATVGTSLAALRQAYGDRLQVRPPPEPDGLPVFVVGGSSLGGTLTGEAPAATVASLLNGTSEVA